jgi:hypothetical protein
LVFGLSALGSRLWTVFTLSLFLRYLISPFPRPNQHFAVFIDCHALGADEFVGDPRQQLIV